MKVEQPQHTRFDLSWHLFGVPIRLTPLFLAASALLGVRYYADPEAGSLGYFAFWMVAVLLSVLLHELGHVLVARVFGLRGAADPGTAGLSVVLSGLGGVTAGIETLPRRWQRLLVLLAGPFVQLLVVAGIWAVTRTPFPEVFRTQGLETPIGTTLAMLLRINYYWALLNLLPLWPLDGGRIACEVGEGLFGRRGQTAALCLSIVTAGLLGILVVAELSWHLVFRYDPRYLLHIEQSSVLLLFCYLLWLRGFKAVWPEELVPPA